MHVCIMCMLVSSLVIGRGGGEERRMVAEIYITQKKARSRLQRRVLHSEFYWCCSHKNLLLIVEFFDET